MNSVCFAGRSRECSADRFEVFFHVHVNVINILSCE